MIATIAVALLLCAQPVYNVQAIALGDEFASCLLAPRSRTGGAVVLVASGNTVAVHDFESPESDWQVRLPEGASAFDYYDLDEDGAGELIVIAGERVLRYGPPKLGRQAPAPERLFSHKGVYTEPAVQPFPHVLVLMREGAPVLALPTGDALELRSPGGALAARVPLLPAPRMHGSFGAAFSAGGVVPPQIASAKGMEFRVSMTDYASVSEAEGLGPVLDRTPPYRFATPRQARDAATLEPKAWPWFSLRVHGNTEERAYYALSGAGPGDTMAVVSRMSGTGAGEAMRLGPERRYPGVLLQPDGPLPDFNGDGFSDLVLWNAPAPAPTVNALSRALIGKNWPLRITMHCFVDAKSRFAPSPSGNIALDAPLSWLLPMDGRAPLPLVVLRDFDGDGLTDFACATAPREFAIWRSEAGAFHDPPDFRRTFPEELRGLAFTAQLRKGKGNCVGLRGKEAVYVIRTVSPATP